MGDPESITYAMDFKAAFRAAGWQFTGPDNDGVSQAAFSGVPRGVIVIVRSREDLGAPELQALGAALAKIGGRPFAELDPKMAQGQFRIVVGAKADP